VFGISLFSLAGVPPTAGFFGKFFLLLAGAGAGNYVLITIAALNMIVSLYYYLVLVKAMFIDANDSPVQKLNVHILPKLAMVTMCNRDHVVRGAQLVLRVHLCIKPGFFSVVCISINCIVNRLMMAINRIICLKSSMASSAPSSKKM
jgi:NADH:ubiquinone oxidoreductase subunit 2 (subunit N)